VTTAAAAAAAAAAHDPNVVAMAVPRSALCGLGLLQSLTFLQIEHGACFSLFGACSGLRNSVC
jgi:hypothetical protein